MKKIIPLVLTLFTLVTSNKTNAQSFTVKDTAYYAVQNTGANENVNNDITNTTTSDLTLKWRVIDHNFPPSWKAAFGLCDNQQCYSQVIITTVPGTEKTTNPIPASSKMPFKVQMDFTGLQSGTYYVTTSVTDGASTSKNTTFMITKFPTSVANVNNANDNITLYPNPAASELNVTFDPAVGVKNIIVYNLIGKALTVYKTTSNSSAKLNIENLPTGVYFIRLSDNQGRVVSNRKFTKQ